ncbi:hypothetical protein [Bacillus sp. FJAT-42376]|uniref:hypothetical protein n=1 Tax=Bacillus sp. FJAT-42376 TaxID=2014076 RepID=UPI0013DD8D60|nr:hypothetical protein [Bacillus sp. FJAT-42376]
MSGLAIKRYFLSELDREQYEIEVLNHTPSAADYLFDWDDAELISEWKNIRPQAQ